MSQRGSFSSRLLRWWDQHGRKDLPWQHPRTPYNVWISEIMLQQTQVSTVIPYFERWMQSFPDIEQLAQAPLDEVLSHWSGLGYYARARNLHRTAQICLQRYDGALPQDSEQLATLPGIGRSTANAIVSQARDQAAAVLDGNVRRVLARHAMVAGWTGSAASQSELWRLAETRLPKTRGADYTQAIMDLGSMVCTRSRPNCTQCPVAADCRARREDVVSNYPASKPKTRVSDREIFLLVVHDNELGVLLEKRPPAGIWGGLWCFPEAESLAELEQKTGLSLTHTHMLPPRQHRLSHLRLHIQPVLLNTIDPKQVKCSALQRWMPLDHQARLGIPKPVTDLLAELRQGELA